MNDIDKDNTNTRLIATRIHTLLPHEKELIYVHEEHLKHGNPRDSRLCAIALAFIQHFGHKEILVSAAQLWVKDDTYECNNNLRQLITDLDRGFKSDPFYIALQ